MLHAPYGPVLLQAIRKQFAVSASCSDAANTGSLCTSYGNPILHLHFGTGLVRVPQDVQHRGHLKKRGVTPCPPIGRSHFERVRQDRLISFSQSGLIPTNSAGFNGGLQAMKVSTNMSKWSLRLSFRVHFSGSFLLLSQNVDAVETSINIVVYFCQCMGIGHFSFLSLLALDET